MRPGTYPGRWPAPAGPLRIALAHEFGIHGLDGVWRPYGTELGREAAHLINEFPAPRGRLDRIACWAADWDTVTPYVFTELGRIPVGLLPPEFAHLVLCRVIGGPVIRLGVRHDWSPTLG
jgi:hypothetical protein